MKIVNRILILISIVFTLNFALNVFAQQDRSSANPQFDRLEDLKRDIKPLLEENNRLKRQYTALMEEFNALDEEVKKYTQEINELRRKNNETKNKHKRNAKLLEELEEGLNAMQNEVLIKQSRISFLRGELMDIEGSEKLITLQLTDKEYKKKEMELELKLKKHLLEEAKTKGSKEIDVLKAELESKLEQEKDILAQIQETELKAQASPIEARKLKKDNIELNKQLIEAQTKKDIQVKENKILQKKQLLAMKYAEGTDVDKKQLNQNLEESVKILEAEQENFNKKMLELEQNRDLKEKLTQEFVEADKANRLLREELSKLQKTIKNLNKDINLKPLPPGNVR